MNLLIEVARYTVGFLLIFMAFRSSWLAWVLFKDYRKSGVLVNRAFGFFFVGLALAALRALALVPLTSPPLWNLAWQAVAYFFIVLGLEMVYEEMKDDHS